MNRLACLGLLLLCGCLGDARPPPAPRMLSLFDLVRMAENGDPYVDSPNPATRVPMSAVVTPPALEFFFRSPPFTTSTTSNTGQKPVLNLLPGLVEGRFAPYVTIELWTNDYGPVWYNPTYFLVKDDGQGGPLIDPELRRPRNLSLPVWTVAPPDRFYSPFWSSYYVIIPDADVEKIVAHPPKSTSDVLALKYPMVEGAVGTWSVVPQVDVDPALRRPTDGSPRNVTAGMPPWMKAIAQAEYSETSLAKMLTLGVNPGGAYYEGQTVDTLFVGSNDFQVLPGFVVKPIPIFVWMDRNSDGSLEPARLPSVMGYRTLYTDEPLQLPGGSPNWHTYWEVFHVIRPAAAKPFYPKVPNPDAPDEEDVFAGARADHNAPLPSNDVSAIPGIARYAGRIAANPKCFELDASAIPPADAQPSQAAAWAKSCQFLDSQGAIETAIQQASIIDTKVSALCPLVLWAPVRP